MEGRLPPDDDDLFEWTDSPERPPREREREETGEQERAGAGARERPGTGERERVGRGEAAPPRGEEEPPGTGERPAVRGGRAERGRRSDTEERRRVRGDTGEFERSGRRPPPGRRARRRDLPARVRRRQDAGVAAVVVALIVGLIVLISGGGGGGEEEQPIPLKRLVGQTIVAKLDAKGPDQALIRRVRKGQVGGVIVFPGSAQSLEADVQQLQQAASAGDNSPLLVMIDQEGGAVKRLKTAPPDRSPRQLGAAGSEDAARAEGEKTGSYLEGLGVNVDLAPVLDVPQPQTAETIASRTFSDDPAVVAATGVAFAQGLQDGGVIATAKHFPGLGRATVNTDVRPVSIAATKEDLQSDIEPFREAVDAGVGMVMVSSASYPTLGSKEPAVFSPAIVQGLLGDDLGFKGVVITDDLEGTAVTSVAKPEVAAVDAIEAGNDLLLFAGSDDASAKAFGSLVATVKRGELDRAPIEDAYRRIASLKKTLGS